MKRWNALSCRRRLPSVTAWPAHVGEVSGTNTNSDKDNYSSSESFQSGTSEAGVPEGLGGSSHSVLKPV